MQSPEPLLPAAHASAGKTSTPEEPSGEAAVHANVAGSWHGRVAHCTPPCVRQPLGTSTRAATIGRPNPD